MDFVGCMCWNLVFSYLTPIKIPLISRYYDVTKNQGHHETT